jgi:hypothetical protein
VIKSGHCHRRIGISGAPPEQHRFERAAALSCSARGGGRPPLDGQMSASRHILWRFRNIPGGAENARAPAFPAFDQMPGLFILVAFPVSAGRPDRKKTVPLTSRDQPSLLCCGNRPVPNETVRYIRVELRSGAPELKSRGGSETGDRHEGAEGIHGARGHRRLGRGGVPRRGRS